MADINGIADQIQGLTLLEAAQLVKLLEEKLGWFEKLAVGPAWAYGAVCALLLLSVELLGYTEAAVPFVYFQF